LGGVRVNHQLRRTGQEFITNGETVSRVNKLTVTLSVDNSYFNKRVQNKAVLIVLVIKVFYPYHRLLKIINLTCSNFPDSFTFNISKRFFILYKQPGFILYSVTVQSYWSRWNVDINNGTLQALSSSNMNKLIDDSTLVSLVCSSLLLQWRHHVFS